VNIVTKRAEDCNSNPTANNKKTAPATNILDESISDRNGDYQETQRHGFSKSLARLKDSKGRTLGRNAAILHRYIAYCVREYGKEIDGKKWVRINLDHIKARYPYMGRSTVDENLLKLKEFGLCEIENKNREFNKPKYDRTRCYHVPQAAINLTMEDPIYLDSTTAGEFKGVAAIIHNNFTSWVREHRKNNREEIVLLSPANLTELLPFSKSTIKRAIKDLIDERFVVPVPGMKCWYRENSRGSKADKVGSKADKGGSNPDEVGSKADNDIYCKRITNVLEKNSKETAPPLLSNTPMCQEEDNIIRHAETSSPDTDDVPPPFFSSLAELHAKNEQLSVHVPEHNATTDVIWGKVAACSSNFIIRHSEDNIDDWNNITEAEELFEALASHYEKFIREYLKDINPSGLAYQIISAATFETVIGAFMWKKCHTGYSHGMSALTGLCYDLWLAIFEALDDLWMRQIKEERIQRENDYASRDQHMEDRTDLSPAEKSRIFRNAVNSMNQVGEVFYDQTHRTNFIKVDLWSLKRVQKLFENNPEASPSDLLDILKKAVRAYINQPAPSEKYKWGIKWHARWGAQDLNKFVRYLRPIMRDVGMEDSPIQNFPGDNHQEQKQEEHQALAA